MLIGEFWTGDMTPPANAETVAIAVKKDGVLLIAVFKHEDVQSKPGDIDFTIKPEAKPLSVMPVNEKSTPAVCIPDEVVKRIIASPSSRACETATRKRGWTEQAG